jgi:hypothetical protein
VSLVVLSIRWLMIIRDRYLAWVERVKLQTSEV